MADIKYDINAIMKEYGDSDFGFTAIDEEEYTNEEYMNQVAPKKNGGKVKNKYVQSSIVRGFK